MAGEEARLRDSADVVVASFFRRSHPLHDRLLRLIDSMELSEGDPELLARLFQMDNLATRMRRHSDTALVLAGHESPRRWTEPVPLVDVLRAAASEIEQYDQIAIDVQSDVVVSDEAAVDIVHLLAELLENAAAFSPESAQVSVSGFADSDGEALIAITDEGPGLPDDYLGWLNWQLAHPTPADATVVRQSGLFAVAHLAARHGISVVLTRPPDGGTTAQVRLPADMVATGAQPWNGASQLEATHGRNNGAPAVVADPHHPAPELTAGQFAAEDSAADADGPAAPDEAVPGDAALTLAAPVPAPAPADSPAPSGPLPIFDSVQSQYAQPPGPAQASATDQAGLPRRIARASPLAAAPADREPPPAPSPESARAGHRRLASFQQGSRRARATAQLEREADPPAEGE